MVNKNIWTIIIIFEKINNREIKLYKSFDFCKFYFKLTNVLLKMSRPTMYTKFLCCKLYWLSNFALNWTKVTMLLTNITVRTVHYLSKK